MTDVKGARGPLAVWCLLALTSLASAAPDAFMAYRSFLKQGEMTGKFAEMGIGTRCFFAANTVNSAGDPYCEYPKIWLGTNRYDFAAFDRQVDDLLAASPDARFLCIIDLNTPDWGVRRYWGDSFQDITHFAGREDWRRETAVWLQDMLRHAERKCGDRMRGYILSGGGTSEWYEICHGKRSRWKDACWREWCAAHGVKHGPSCPGDLELSTAAFENEIYDPATESEKLDYWRFHSELCPRAILHFVRAAREVLPKAREIGVFFGYALESNDLGASFAHLGYEKVFASPDIDFVISPGNYSDRDIGAGAGSQIPHGTARRYGKRLLHEIDYAPHGNTRWKTPWKTLADDLAGDTREAAFAIANHCHCWWFDMWGGFYDDPRLRERIRRLAEISARFADDDSSSLADVLLVCDPQSMLYVNERTLEAKRPYVGEVPLAATRFRNALSRSGAVYDVVSFNDLAVLDLSAYRMICLPLAIEITPARERLLRERVCVAGRTVVWCRTPGISDGRSLDTRRIRRWAGVEYGTKGISTTAMPGGWRSVYAPSWKDFTPERLNEISRAAGCWRCLDECVPVVANRRFLSVHVKDGGRKKLHLKERVRRVTDLLTGAVLATDADGFEADFASPDTKMFSLDP